MVEVAVKLAVTSGGGYADASPSPGVPMEVRVKVGSVPVIVSCGARVLITNAVAVSAAWLRVGVGVAERVGKRVRDGWGVGER